MGYLYMLENIFSHPVRNRIKSIERYENPRKGDQDMRWSIKEKADKIGVTLNHCFYRCPWIMIFI